MVLAGCEKKQKTVSISLLDELPRANIRTMGPSRVRESMQNVAGERRKVLFMHPPSEVEFEFLVPAAARLVFGIGIGEICWNKKGDGVLFTVRVDNGSEDVETLYSRYINPKAVEADRAWHDEVVDLGLFERQHVKLILATDPGPEGHGGHDFAGWSDPKIVGRTW
jgi:hypothetical protein